MNKVSNIFQYEKREDFRKILQRFIYFMFILCMCVFAKKEKISYFNASAYNEKILQYLILQYHNPQSLNWRKE